MNGSRFLPLALGLSVLLVSEGAAQSAKTCKCSTTCCEAAADDVVCKVYPLAEVDADTAVWIAKTIPEVVEPGSWRPAGGKAVLSFFPPKRIMVVTQTAEGHRRIEAFLKEVCRASAATSGRATGTGFATTAATSPVTSASPGLLPAHMSTMTKTDPRTLKTTTVKAAERIDGAPRHLFHIIVDGLESGDMKMKNFTLKYEGEGIIDSNIVEILKGIGAQTWSETIPSLPSAMYLKTAPMCVPAPSCGAVPANAVVPTPPDAPPVPKSRPNTPAATTSGGPTGGPSPGFVPTGPPISPTPGASGAPFPLTPTASIPGPMTTAPIPVLSSPPIPPMTSTPMPVAPMPPTPSSASTPYMPPAR